MCDLCDNATGNSFWKVCYVQDGVSRVSGGHTRRSAEEIARHLVDRGDCRSIQIIPTREEMPIKFPL